MRIPVIDRQHLSPQAVLDIRLEAERRGDKDPEFQALAHWATWANNYLRAGKKPAPPA